MAHIPAQIAGAAQPHHGVEVCAVDIDLPAMLMSDFADLGHGFLEHAVGRGIGDHATRKGVRMLLGLGAEIIQINVAILC